MTKQKVLFFGVATEGINYGDFCSFMEDGKIRKALCGDVPTKNQPNEKSPLEKLINKILYGKN